ncbi:MAG: hypothetical protein ACE5I3_15425, partial [Phycisphaerae bacterium]
ASPPVLQRIYDAELKSTDSNKFTAAELITTLRSIIWGQLDEKPQKQYTDAEPYISSIGRNLQRAYLDLMLAQARSRPGSMMSADLSSMIRQSLRELSQRMDTPLGRATKPGTFETRPDSRAQVLDFASRAHLIDCQSRIDRVLAAQFTER